MYISEVFSCVLVCQGHPAGESERLSLSLAPQLLLHEQPLSVPGLFSGGGSVHPPLPAPAETHTQALHTPAQCLRLRPVAGGGPGFTRPHCYPVGPGPAGQSLEETYLSNNHGFVSYQVPLLPSSRPAPRWHRIICKGFYMTFAANASQTLV